MLLDDLIDDNDRRLKTKVIESIAKSIVNEVPSVDIPMSYSMNPYQGCEHGCVYCYARNTHNYWGYSAGLDFETNIIVKTNAAELLKKKLNSKHWKPSPIMMSGSTDCYQPVEKKYKITRSLLQCCLDFKHPVGLITKNNLILRDLDILKALNEMNLVTVAISINTLDDTLRQKLEPRASSIPSRLKLIASLVDNDIPVTALAAPIIPGLNDHDIFPLVKKLAELGVNGIGQIVIRLNGDVAKIFEHWLNQYFPDRAKKVINKIKELHGGQVNDNRFKKRMKGEGKIAEIIHQQFKLAKSKYLTELPFEYNLDSYLKFKNPQFKFIFKRLNLKMNFTLRPIEVGDLECLLKYANNAGVAGNLTNRFPYPYTENDGIEFIKFATKENPRNIMAIDIETELSGCIGIHPQSDIFHKNAELGYWLAEKYWSKGIMTNAIKQMVDYGFKNWDIDRIFAKPFGRNIGSQKALEKSGFKLEARLEKTIFKNSQYEDELIYGFRRSDL